MHEASSTQDLVNETQQIENWIHRWGVAASEAILDPAFHYFRTPDIEGVIGYRLEYGCAIVFGEPVCAPENISQLATAFRDHCQERHLDVIFLVCSEPFAKWAISHICEVLIEVGEEMIFDPFYNNAEGSKQQKLRNKIRHASNAGVTFKEYTSKNESMEKYLQQAGSTWLKERRGPKIYLTNLDLFERSANRRWFIVEKAGIPIGITLLTGLKNHEEWLLKFHIISPKAPRGTSELLMMSILDTLRQENCHSISYGMVSGKQLGEIVGLGRFASFMARLGFQLAKWFFRLDKRKQYWKQFHPTGKPLYILFTNKNISFQIRALLKSLNVNI